MTDSRGTILVTGAAGYLGRRVAHRLRAHGWDVLGIDRAEAETVQLVDIRDAAHLDHVLQERPVRRIVHLASLLNTASRLEPQPATEVNIGGSLNLFDLARKYGVERVVYASSISVYGTQGQEAVKESDPVAPQDLYGAAKCYVELLGEAYHRLHRVGFAALRIATVIGAGATGTASPWRSQIFEALKATVETEIAIPYRDEEVLPLVHSDDVAEMLVTLATAEQPAGSIYNSPAEAVRMSELQTWVESANPRIKIALGSQEVSGFPRGVDGSRFEREFGFGRQTIKERLEQAARDGG
jgi:nucleoside-diphosphate-sugar epimerase